MTSGSLDLESLRPWIGRSETLRDEVRAGHVAMIAATLDYAWRPAAGEPLPPLWHWAFFPPVVPLSDLCKDGHPQLGAFMPPIPLPRRMWVGGRLTFHHPVEVGEQIEKTTSITNITAKSGRNGALIFVTLTHQIRSRSGVAITEEQDLVYRQAAATPNDPKDTVVAQTPVPVADWRKHMLPGPVMLFRYSAVTFNSHRIHYDEAYARTEEGYPGLVVQGPLTATLLVDQLCANRPGTLKSFSFRAHQPLFCDQRLSICGKAGDSAGAYSIWAETPTGALAMSGTAVLGD